ncbi:hypothetical protein PIROE2DRAFT_2847 [Piromyces sp. E2]|nr:hypothetical protein PIROE2DRAFT_2847 [Piromyces sp. E2]|eukprot:OUM69337.1 hypothetical protein PIROE2DRAFT_2847 [Piromyces sp. E2]
MVYIVFKTEYLLLMVVYIKKKLRNFIGIEIFLKKSIKADNYIENKINLKKQEDNCEQSLEYWLLNCSSFNEIRNDVINNLDIFRSFFNSDSRNVNSGNSDNISGNNSSEIGLNNSSHEISNNSDSVNENLFKLFTLKLLARKFSLSVNRSSINRSNRKCSKVFNFLFVGGRGNNNRNQIEWENLCKYQLKSGNLSDIPFLAKTAAFFNKVRPIVSSQRWSVINRYSTKVTKSANADNTVRQANIANDHNHQTQ